MTPRAAVTALSLARRIHKLEQAFQNRPPRGQRLITLRFVDLLRRSDNLTEDEQREFDDWEPLPDAVVKLEMAALQKVKVS